MFKAAVIFQADIRHKELLERINPQCKFDYYQNGIPDDIIGEYDIIFGGVPKGSLKKAVSLKLLQLQSAGADVYAERSLYANNDVVLACASGAYGLALSECMLAMHLTLIKKHILYLDNMRDCLWQNRGPVTSVYGSTVLCLGTGDIGGQYARKVKALGAYVIGVCRSKQDKPDFIDELYTENQLNEIITRADILAISLPGTPATIGMVSRELIEKMKPSAYIINVGRGSVLDTTALCDALETGRLAGAALDVTDPEPLPSSHRLWRLPNVLITPHAAGNFNLPLTKDLIVQNAAENIRQFCLSGTVRRPVSFIEKY